MRKIPVTDRSPADDVVMDNVRVPVEVKPRTWLGHATEP